MVKGGILKFTVFLEGRKTKCNKTKNPAPSPA
jgi:hypothetical protein